MAKAKSKTSAGTDARNLLKRLLALELTSEERCLVILFYRDGFTFAEIAARLGVTTQRAIEIFDSINTRAQRAGGVPIARYTIHTRRLAARREAEHV